MADDWAQAEGERITANMIRVGRITEVDAANGLAKMRVGGLDTDWLPWGVARAGGTRTASAPTVGEQRLVFAPYGDTGQAVIGQALYQDDHPTPTSSADEDVTVYPDGTRVSYNSDTGTLQLDVAAAGKVVVNCKEATVNAQTSVTLNTPDTHLTGNLQVDGNAAFSGASVTHGGKNIGKTHTHTSSSPGSPTSPPN